MNKQKIATKIEASTNGNKVIIVGDISINVSVNTGHKGAFDIISLVKNVLKIFNQ